MSDARGYDDQSLPWLEAVENEDGPRAISARKMLVALLLVLTAGAIVAGTMFWLGRGPDVIGAPADRPSPALQSSGRPPVSMSRAIARRPIRPARAKSRSALYCQLRRMAQPAFEDVLRSCRARRNPAHIPGATRDGRRHFNRLPPSSLSLRLDDKAGTALQRLSPLSLIAALQKSVVTATIGGNRSVALRAVDRRNDFAPRVLR